MLKVGCRVKTKRQDNSWSFREAYIVRQGSTKDSWIVKYVGNIDTEEYEFNSTQLLKLEYYV